MNDVMVRRMMTLPQGTWFKCCSTGILKCGGGFSDLSPLPMGDPSQIIL
jgi:hypothetical protein